MVFGLVRCFCFYSDKLAVAAVPFPALEGWGTFFWNKQYMCTEFKENKYMIDTHRFATYILLYLFSGGFRGTSLFTNEAMFFVTYVVILQKSDKNPTEM